MAGWQKYWGQGANTNNSGWGAGANNTIGWGSVHANSSGHDETDLVGVPSIYVGNSNTADGAGDPTGGTSTLLLRNRIEARPYWTTRQNLLTYSEDFSNAAWTKSAGVTITSNSAVAPDGTTTADTLTRVTSGNAEQTASVVSGQNYAFTVRAKEDSNGILNLVTTSAFPATVVEFDITNQTATPTTGTPVSTNIESLGNGWYACTLVQTANATSNGAFRILTADNNSIFIWGAQLNEGSTAGEYVKTEANPYSFAPEDTQLNDYSGSNNGAQIHSGGALSFDGVNDEVDAGDVGTIRTVSMLVNPDSASETLIDLDGSVHISTASGDLNVSGAIGSTNYVDGVVSDTVGSGSYKLVTVVFDSDVTADAVKIGRQGGNYGSLDVSDVKMYSGALTAAEVLANYNNPQQPILSGLETWYDFNELSGLTLFDRSGNGYNGAINGATPVSGVKEGYQPALAGFNNYQTFDGTDDSVSLTDVGLEIGTAHVLNVKFTLAELSKNQGIFAGLSTTSNRYSVQLRAADNILSVGFYNGSSWVGVASTDSAIDINTIYEIEWVYDGTNSTLTVNNVLQSGTTAPTVTTNLSTNTAEIGTSAPTSYTNGIIDYVEVEGVGRWSNLGGWVDEIGSNDGTVNGSPVTARIAGAEYNSTTDVFSNTIQNAYIANALNFSGGYSGLFVDAGANVDTSGAVSTFNWVKPNSTTAGQTIYSNGQLELTLDGSNQPVITRDGGTGSVTGNAAIANGLWDSVTIASASGGGTNIYLGDKATEPAIAQATPNASAGTATTGSTNFIIGNDSGGTNPFDGYVLYELAWTEDLSAANTDLTKIEQVWQVTKNLIPVNEGTLVYGSYAARVLADGGTLEAKACTINDINDLI